MWLNEAEILFLIQFSPVRVVSLKGIKKINILNSCLHFKSMQNKSQQNKNTLIRILIMHGGWDCYYFFIVLFMDGTFSISISNLFEMDSLF